MDKVAKRINMLYRSISTHKKLTLEGMIECGKLLYDQKWKNEGHFLLWLKENVEFSERTAHKYMRVYKLNKQGYWDKEDTPANNLARNAEPNTFKQCINQSRAEEISRKHDIKLTTAKNYVKAIDKIPELEKKIEVQIVNGISKEQESKLRIKLFEAMECAYDLGRRNKLLTINKKREVLDKLLKIINGSK